MTEHEWLNSEKPHEMMTYLTYLTIGTLKKPMDRKLQLYCLACCWENSTWDQNSMHDLGEDAQRCIEMNLHPARDPYNWTMAWAGDQIQPSTSIRASMIRDIFGNPFNQHPPLHTMETVKVDIKDALKQFPSMKSTLTAHKDQLVQKIKVKPHWLTQQVTDIATITSKELRGPECKKCKGKGGHYGGYVTDLFHPWVICDQCDGKGHFRGQRLDPLSLSAMCDAMEESGCNDIELLNHFRQPQLHYSGCWVLDLILSDNKDLK